jgi:hypothetical protein
LPIDSGWWLSTSKCAGSGQAWTAIRGATPRHSSACQKRTGAIRPSPSRASPIGAVPAVTTVADASTAFTPAENALSIAR